MKEKFIVPHLIGKSPIGRMDFVNQRIRFDMQTGCWLWMGARQSSDSYGRMRAEPSGRRRGYAHRIIYEMHVGPIPSGLDIDHLCRNPQCVNPDHLEPVTHAENVRRGVARAVTIARLSQVPREEMIARLKRMSALGLAAKRANPRPTCSKGHPYGESPMRHPKGGRLCRECARLRIARSRAKKTQQRQKAQVNHVA